MSFVRITNPGTAPGAARNLDLNKAAAVDIGLLEVVPLAHALPVAA